MPGITPHKTTLISSNGVWKMATRMAAMVQAVQEDQEEQLLQVLLVPTVPLAAIDLN